MNVLIVGSGGREHTLAWLALKSPLVEKVFCFGGDNFGMRQDGMIMMAGDVNDNAAIVKAAREIEDVLVIIGPEAPLCNCVVNHLQIAGIRVYGPTEAAAQLEGSKLFANEVMEAAGIPTANYNAYDSEFPDEVRQLLEEVAEHQFDREPLVFKADGLAAGKGVSLARNPLEAIEAIHAAWVARKFGAAGNVLLTEEYLPDHPGLRRSEFSILTIVAKDKSHIILPAAQDYKPINDNDEGGMTGGMGSYSPVPWLTDEMLQQVKEEIINPLLEEMQRRNCQFYGTLYLGLKWCPENEIFGEGPYVVEFNVRFGDPEVQSVLMNLKSDIIPVLLAVAMGESIADMTLEFKDGFSVCLVGASEGYPESSKKGLEITGLETLPEAPGFKVFHAGTRENHGVCETNGGRVLDVTVSSETMERAAEFALECMGPIKFGGEPPKHRTDIGKGVDAQVGAA